MTITLWKSYLLAWVDGGSPDGDDEAEEAWPLAGKGKTLGRSPWLGDISEEVESKYLTMSW